MKPILARISKVLFPAFFLAAGIAHFLMPDFYVRRLPSFVPLRRELVIAAGIFEAAAAVLAFRRQTRKVASRAIMVFLLCVVPPNIFQLVMGQGEDAVPMSVLWARVGFLLLLSSWAYANSRIEG
jgi:uncharacterized membrane protein